MMLALLGLLAACGSSVRAAVIMVEPDAFPAGTNISNAYPGVTLSSIGSDPRVFSFTPTLAPASTGARVFGHFTPFEEQWGDGANYDLRADLATATDSVAVDIIGNDSSDQGTLRAFNAANVQVGSQTSGIVGLGVIQTLTITRPSPDIAYIIASGTTLETVNLDNLRFSIPEPSSLALAGMGGLVIAWRRRRC